MSFLDAILNIACLLLWIDWRAGRGAGRPRAVLTLANAVRPAERRRAPAFGSLAVLILILAVRPSFYYSIGSKLGWTPQLDLLAISIPWRSDLLDLIYLYSTVTFALTLGFFYTCLLLLSAVNRDLPDTDVIQHFIRLQLGWLELAPWWLKLVLPVIGAGLAWAGAASCFSLVGVLPAQLPPRVLWGESLALSLGALLAWKWLLLVFFLLHILNVYVYLGSHPFWAYLSLTARRLLWPVSFLTFPKLDLAPAAGIALVFCVSELVLKPSVLYIFQRFSV